MTNASNNNTAVNNTIEGVVPMTINNNKQREINKKLSVANRLFKQASRGASLQVQMADHNTMSTILNHIAQHNGLGVKTKNYAMITKAVSQGFTVPAIMADPSLAGVPANQHHWFSKFMAENNIPATVKAPTRKRVRVAQANINAHYINENNEIVLKTEIVFMSESQLSETFGTAEVDHLNRPFVGMVQLVYVNMKLVDEENEELKELQERMVREGFLYEVDGELHKASFFIQTASQARLLQGVYIRDSFMSIPDAFRALGHDFKTYSKRKWDGEKYIYTLDVTKYLKRPGLSGTSTIVSQAVSFPNARLTELPHGEYRIDSDMHSIYVTNDRFAKIKNGTFKAFYKNRIVTVVAEDGVFTATWTAHGMDHKEVLPMDHLKLGAGDGMLLADEEVYYALRAEFGVDSDAWQIRLTPFGKGLLVFVPGLRKYYNANIVAFKSAIKGDYRLMTDEEGYLNYNIALRIARFAKNPKDKAQYTTFPYQFTHVTSLNFEDMKKLVDPHLANMKNVLTDASLVQKYAGVAHMENMDRYTTAEMDFMREKSLVSTFSNFMHYAPFTFEDAWMQQQAITLMQEEMKKWVAGTIPVEGQYRFMVQDPYALLNAVMQEDGDFIVPEHVGMRPDQAFVIDRDGKPMLGRMTSFRNPAITKGEGRILKGAAPQNYLEAAAKGAFSSVLTMSVHDMNTFAEGGADNDGDESFITQEPIILKSLSDKDGNSKFIPVLDVYVSGDGEWESGCPFKMPVNQVLSFGAESSSYDGQFKISFTEDQYNDTFVQAVHELSKEYVIRTLTPNKIGYLTDIATRLADTVRKIGYMIAEGKDDRGYNVTRTAAEKKALIDMIADYEYMIDLLRLCIGWEIDRAKHGGAYEEQLAMELSFVENPPMYAGFTPKGEKKSVWNNAAWMRHHKGKDGGMNTGSVLSRVFDYMTSWVEENLNAKSAEIASNVDDHNLIATFKSGYAINPDVYNAIASEVRSVRYSFGKEMSELIMVENRLMEEAVLADTVISTENAAILKEKRTDSIERHQMMMAALEKAFDSKDIGYVSYVLTYTERGSNGNASIAFPWSIAKKQFLDLCASMASREITLNNFIVEAADVSVKFRVNAQHNAEKMAAYLNNAKELFVEYTKNELTGNMTYVVTVVVNGTHVYAGDVYKDQEGYFTGASKFRCVLTSAEAKKQSMYLQVNAIERV